MSGTEACRICLEDDDCLGSIGDGARLIQPCACKGSMRLVHRRCLDEWRATSQKRESWWACDLCQATYKFHQQNGIRRAVRYLAAALTCLALAKIVLLGGYAMKMIELVLTREVPVFDSFVRVDALHLIYGLLLPSAIGLGPFCSIVNIGAPHVLNVFVHGLTLESMGQYAAEITVSLIGIAVGMSRITIWLFEHLHRLLQHTLTTPDLIVDLNECEQDCHEERCS